MFNGKVCTFCGKVFNLMGNFVHLIRKSIYFYGKSIYFLRKFVHFVQKFGHSIGRSVHFVDTVFCPLLICMLETENSKKEKSSFFHWGTVGTSRLLWFNLIRSQSAQSVISSQSDHNALGQPELTERWNWSKLHQNDIFLGLYIKSKIIGAFCQLWPNLT